MKPADYPAQEPLSEFARAYHNKVMDMAAGLEGQEFNYGPDPYQSLLVFASPRPSGDVLTMMHGGGWTNGYKEWMAFMAPALNDNGIALVSLGYRLAPQHTFPAGLEDCQRALAWVYHNVARTGGVRERIFVAGHSAGGHYASLLAVRRDWQEALRLPDNVIHGCLPVSGVYRFGPGSGLSVQPRFLGTEDNVLPASPIANIAANPPPFFIAYGSDDFPHLRQQAIDMAAALRAAGGHVTCQELPECDHLGASYATGQPRGPWVGPAVRFMQAQ